MGATSITSYRRHKYSGPRKCRKRVRAQLRHHHNGEVSREKIWRKKRKIEANESKGFSSSENNKQISGNRAPVKTYPPQSVFAIQVKEKCNDELNPLALEPDLKIEPVDIKQEISEDTDDGPSGKYIEVTLKNEYDDYIEINENEIVPSVKVEQEDD